MLDLNQLRPVCIPMWAPLSSAELRQMAHRGERPVGRDAEMQAALAQSPSCAARFTV